MKSIVAFGNPLLDTIVLIKDEVLLKKYNLEPDGQKEVSQKEMSLLQQDLLNTKAIITTGGCAQNTLKILQWLFQKQCSATMFGAVGGDKEGQLLKDLMEKAGVDTHYIIHDSYPTGRTIALVNGENRSLTACLGAAEVLSLDDVKTNQSIINQIDKSQLVYVEGFFLTKRVEAATFILNHCNFSNKDFAFNLCGEYLCREYPEAVLFFMERSNIIFGNRREFEALCPLVNEDNVEDLVITLGRKNKIIVVTNGSSPVLFIGDGETLSEIEVPSLKSEEVVDTTGAGDSFVAGFLAGYMKQKPLKTCVEIGCYAAQEIIKVRGCTVPKYCPAFAVT